MNAPQTTFTTERKGGNNVILADVAQGLGSWRTHNENWYSALSVKAKTCNRKRSRRQVHALRGIYIQ